MDVKKYTFSQLADLRVEGVGIHASFSVSVLVNEKNFHKGKDLYISATGRSNAAKAAGSGRLFPFPVV